MKLLLGDGWTYFHLFLILCGNLAFMFYKLFPWDELIVNYLIQLILARKEPLPFIVSSVYTRPYKCRPFLDLML